MVNGILWFDDVGTLEERLGRAALYFEDKRGVKADHVLVNTGECYDAGYAEGGELGGVIIEPSNLMLPRHYLMGVRRE